MPMISKDNCEGDCGRSLGSYLHPVEGELLGEYSIVLNPGGILHSKDMFIRISKHFISKLNRVSVPSMKKRNNRMNSSTPQDPNRI